MDQAASRAERAYFDRFVQEHGEFNPFADRGWATLARRFSQAVGSRTGLRILDVGCGTGHSRQIYVGHARSYLGLDISPASVTIASALHRPALFVAGNALRLPLRASCADVVAFSSVLHHIPERDAALSEAVRVLAPGGLVFAFDPNVLHPAMALFRHPSSPLYTSKGVSPNEKPLLPASLRRSFASSGFVEIKQRGQADIPYRYVAPRLLNALLALYNLGDRLMAASRIDRWLGSFVVTWARKSVVATADGEVAPIPMMSRMSKESNSSRSTRDGS